jgi:hypothetical protein
MSVIIHRHFGNIAESSDPAKLPATASDLAFGRQSENRNFWRPTWALIKRTYAPLLVYAILAIAIVAVMATRVAVWVPQLWR